MENEAYENSERPIELDIKFGPQSEIARVTDTFGRLPWYRKNGYRESNVLLPKAISEQSSQEEIAEAVSAEFVPGPYEDFSLFIQEHWDEVSANLEKLKELKGFILRDNYTVVLTKYGSGGSYKSDKGIVFLNFDVRKKEEIIGTMVHEIIHIGIEHWIQQFNIEQWHKERLVDLIGEKLFPDLRHMQYIKDDVSIVDEAFLKFFPDMEAVVREMGDNEQS